MYTSIDSEILYVSNSRINADKYPSKKYLHIKQFVLISNNCSIDQVQLNANVDQCLFCLLKHLHMSNNQISSYQSINELSRLPSLISFSIRRNLIYLTNQLVSQTAKQMIIAHLSSLTYLNRVFIQRNAEVDHLQSGVFRVKIRFYP